MKDVKDIIDGVLKKEAERQAAYNQSMRELELLKKQYAEISAEAKHMINDLSADVNELITILKNKEVHHNGGS